MSQEIEGFKIAPFLVAAEELLRADETIRALSILDNLPGFYRDYPPPEVTSLKREIMSKIATASFYAAPSEYEIKNFEAYLHMSGSLRGSLLVKDVESQELPFLIIDMGPGEYWVPMMLKHLCLDFFYKPVYVNQTTLDFYRPNFEKHIFTHDLYKGPTMFFACEVIEHLWNENEIRFEMERHQGLCDVVHISTPLYTYDYGCMDWKEKGDLGHLRTYTPREFHDVVSKMFPEYLITIYQSPILHARLVLKETKFKILMESQYEPDCHSHNSYLP